MHVAILVEVVVLLREVMGLPACGGSCSGLPEKSRRFQHQQAVDQLQAFFAESRWEKRMSSTAVLIAWFAL